MNKLRDSRLKELNESKILAYIEDQSKEKLKELYDRAVADGNEQEAADFARQLRDLFLRESDKEFLLDRLPLDTSGALNFVKSVIQILKSPTAGYRKLLRDLPTQKGFPFNIEWPVNPVKE